MSVLRVVRDKKDVYSYLVYAESEGRRQKSNLICKLHEDELTEMFPEVAVAFVKRRADEVAVTLTAEVLV